MLGESLLVVVLVILAVLIMVGTVVAEHIYRRFQRSVRDTTDKMSVFLVDLDRTRRRNPHLANAELKVLRPGHGWQRL
jgi:hypothetical protein